MKNKSIILLSGGLDSLVSLALCKELYNVQLALTFDYGQKAFGNEFLSSKKIAEYYNLEFEVVNLNWLKKISNSTITNDTNIPVLSSNDLDDIKTTEESAKSVWVPNRNALFVNIAACYADAKKYSHIIIGANKEESLTFKDNSKNFINTINNSLLNSTNNPVQVYAPLIEFDKNEIVMQGIKYNAPFNLLYSCYQNNKKHCGKCESCLRLKRALELNNRYDIISQLF